jgi:hypothetical protein
MPTMADVHENLDKLILMKIHPMKLYHYNDKKGERKKRTIYLELLELK